MATRLHDIRPGHGSAGGEGVSLVFRGANRRRFLIAKTDTGELDADVAEILAAPAASEAALLDAVRKSGGDESVEKAAATAARAVAAVREAYGDKLPDELAKAMRDGLLGDDEGGQDGDPADKEDEDVDDEISKAEQPVYKRDFTAEQRRALAKNGQALPNGSYPIESSADIGPAVTLAQSGHGDVDAAKALINRRARELGATDQLPDSWKPVKKEDGMPETAVPVKKEDGTWDLSAVPEEQRPALELLMKSHDDELAELRKTAEAEATKADEATKIAKAVEERLETTEYVAKSASLEHLTKDDAEFGPVLRVIAKAEEAGHLPEGTVEKLDTVLKAANEAIEKGDLFSEVGRAGHGAGGDAQAKLDAKAAELRKDDPTLTKEGAVAKALELDPSLYTDIRKEQS